MSGDGSAYVAIVQGPDRRLFLLASVREIVIGLHGQPGARRTDTGPLQSQREAWADGGMPVQDARERHARDPESLGRVLDG